MPIFLFLIIASALVFLNAIWHPFVHDDIVFILQNPHIAQWDNFKDVFFASSNTAHTQQGGINAYYRPILELFYRCEYQLFGFNPAGFHLINVIIHTINGLLVFALLCRLGFQRTMAGVISLIFLIHPIQTESVACVSGISNLLAGLFILVTLHSYYLHRYLLAVLTFGLALLTKEQAIVLLPLIILVDVYKKQNYKYFLWFVFAFLTLMFFFLRAISTGSHLIDDILSSPGELVLRIQSIPQTILTYLRLIVLPYDLHYYRNLDILADHRLSYGVFTLFLGTLFILTKKLTDIRRGVLFGLGWFIVCLLPVLNIIPLINEYSYIFIAEHFLYLPMIGVVIALAVLIRRLIVSNQLLRILTVLICLNMAGLSIFQNTFWKSELALFERMSIFEPNFGRGHILLAKAYYQDKKIDKAIEHYLKALKIMNGYALKASNMTAREFYRGFIRDINTQLAQCFQIQGNLDQALAYYNEALAQKAPEAFVLLNNMAVCYIQKQDKIQAEQYLKLALGLNPTYAPARDNLDKLLKSN